MNTFFLGGKRKLFFSVYLLLCFDSCKKSFFSILFFCVKLVVGGLY